jgi:positive regulator of sigma E activity
MKPAINETGTIIEVDGDYATVSLAGGHSCKGCGAGKIGLCNPGGRSMMLRVKNTAGGRAGDRVRIGAEGRVRRAGYLFAYIIPLLSFIGGSFGGHAAGAYYSFGSLDVLTGFLVFAVGSLYSMRKLRALDRTSSLEVSRVLSENSFEVFPKSDEERFYERYAMK